MFFEFNPDGKNESIPSFDEMMLPVLEALLKNGGKASNEEIDLLVIELMNLPKDIMAIRHNDTSSRSEVSYRLAWARTYLKKYGMIRNESRGIWSLTDNFDGNLQTIDIEDIKRSVRNENHEKQRTCEDESNNLNGFETVQAFENMTISLLKDLASSQGKQAYLAYSDQFDLGIDLILPQGIDDCSESLDCVIKYFSTRNEKGSIDLSIIIDKHKSRSGKILLVTNVVISKEEISRIGDKIIVWDKDELIKKIDPEKPYAQYLLNAREALIKDIVRSENLDKNKDKEMFINNVKRAFKREDMTLFLGAGVSQDGGIPLWSTLIKQLHISMIHKLTENDELSFEEQKMISGLATDNEINSPLLQMRYIKSAFSASEYYEFVYSVLYKEKLNIEGELLNSIAKICTPQRSYCGIKCVVTYNFDDLLEKKLKQKDISFNVISCEEDKQLVERLNVYHVHGFLPSNKKMASSEPDLIFSEEDYHKVYRDAYSWSNLVQLNSLRENTCLFIGCSLTDPNLRRLLDVASRNGEKPRHYAFMKKSEIKDIKKIVIQNKDLIQIYQRINDNIQTGYYSQLGINIIWVDEYEEIPIILNSFLN